MRLKRKPRLYGILDPELYRLQECEEASLFDKCLDYEKFTRTVIELYNSVLELREQHKKKTFNLWSSYLALTIVMLANGLRVREAIRAIARFYETGERRITIKAEKGGDIRNVIIPSFIEREDVELLYKKVVKIGEESVRVNVKDWLRKVFRVNPHSIRYAYIRYHTLTGKNVEEIARGLGLREARTVKRYYLRGLMLEGEGEEGG